MRFPDMAMKLEEALGIPYIDWMGFQERFIRDSRAVQGDVNQKSQY